MIHDGARPFADGEIIGRVMEDAVLYGACAAGMPSKDTVKLSDDDGFAKMTPDRNKVWMIQTPQGFSYPLLMEAYDKMMSFEEYQEGVTDDAMVVERQMGVRVHMVEGSYENIKITTPEDLDIAEVFAKQQRTGRF